MQYIVTIKLPRNKEHDPQNKKTGQCIFSAGCTDVTGEHHSTLVDDEGLASIKASTMHVTRIEPL